MYNGYKVVAVTPAGRQRYLEILAPYIINNELVDEWRLWVNTADQQDLRYIHALEFHSRKTHGKIKLEIGNPAIPIIQERIGYSIYQYFRNCCDTNTIYIRFDDDICYVAPPAIHNLLISRMHHCESFLVFANINNNAIISHLQQRFRRFDCNKIITYNCTDEIGWNNGQFAESLHREFLDRDRPWYMPDWELNIYERFSINCFAFFGRDFASFGGIVDPNEECWLTIDKPRELQRPNLVCGDSIVSHYAFYTQRPYLDTTDILDKYRQLSLQLNKES
jgi:hypothetical protein